MSMAAVRQPHACFAVAFEYVAAAHLLRRLCLSEFSQWLGQCRNCKGWECLQPVTLLPEPPPSAASGASAAAKVLRGRGATSNMVGSSSSTSSTRSRRGNSSRDPAASISAADDDASTDDMTGPVDFSGPEYDSYDESSVMYDRQQQRQQRQHQRQEYGSSSAGSTAWSGGWIATDDSAPAVPQRLADITGSDAQLRLPLPGATGAEVARVLGGGLIPGSLVLVGGEPGTGKSTLLLQVAGLVAHACGSGHQGSTTAALQQHHGAPSNGTAAAAADGAGGLDDASSDEEDDLPLAARMAAAAAGNGSSSSTGSSIFESSSTSWLDEAAAAAASAGGGGGLLLPPGFRGRPVLYVTAEESREQVGRVGAAGAGVGACASPGPAAAPQQRQRRRWGCCRLPADVRLLVENRVESIAAAMVELAPAAVVVDSIQTVALRSLAQRPGSITQVRESANCLLHVAKQLGCATFLVGHVTKSGDVAGPKHLEHLVDVVLYLQGAAGAGGAGARQGGLRLLRAAKNRHGRVGEVGLFEMKGGGLCAVKDAAALFLPSTSAAAEASKDLGSGSELVGTAIGVVLDGIRPLPLEIQALATPRLVDTAAGSANLDDTDEFDAYDSVTSDSDSEADPLADEDGEEGLYEQGLEDGSGSSGISTDSDEPGLGFGGSLTRSRGRDRVDVSGVSRELAPLFRHYVGLADKPRMAMLLELLSKYTPIKASRSSCHLYNLFLNVVSGIRVPPGETSTDLAVLAAIASSVANTPLPPGTALLGEVGLAGELRQVPNLELRLLELSKLGFSSVVVPAAGGPLALSPSELGGMDVRRQHSLGGALQELFGAETLRKAGWYRKKREDGEGGKEAGKDRVGGRSRRQSRTDTSSSSSSASANGLGQDTAHQRTRGSRRR
ncbi:hypothetical protein COO60DRAFT_1700490 [Scenedesmus sp. NREL 46B-D3]|nr:hypothetical protein COO60DRAFT_1700490 [Scenedesmus sp. NREL 46B-D3]